MKTFLHVGCGHHHKAQTTATFAGPDWQEIRLDIDPNVRPDVISGMTDMRAVPDESIDAIFSAHNIEHLYPHEVPKAFAEFLRVLKPEGFLVITCPDLQAVAALVAEDRLEDTAYVSAAGPIAPLDMIYGHRAQIAEGNLFMAHHCGFTEKTLAGALERCGFKSTASTRRPFFFDLWSVAAKAPLKQPEMLALATAHFPKSP